MPRPAAPTAAAIAAAPRPEPVEGTDRASRVAQVAMGALLGVVSALLMVTCHRVAISLGDGSLPLGLILGAVLQTACCVFLLASTGRRLGLVALAAVWCLVALTFIGPGVGGGVVVPAQIGGRAQYQGWALQILGLGIPLVALAVATIGRIRSATAAPAGSPR